jgi:hypothetical protein
VSYKSRTILIYILVLSIVLIPAQSFGAMSMGHSTVNMESGHGEWQHNHDGASAVDHIVSTQHGSTTIPHTAIEADGGPCETNQAICKHCNICGHCVNLINTANWRYIPVANNIDVLPSELIPFLGVRLLLRPPIRS